MLMFRSDKTHMEVALSQSWYTEDGHGSGVGMLVGAVVGMTMKGVARGVGTASTVGLNVGAMVGIIDGSGVVQVRGSALLGMNPGRHIQKYSSDSSKPSP
jgi:L-aminopeptidase/D-esterase-like protein